MNATSSGAPVPSLPKLLLGFATIYVIWGTTYLGIRYAVESFPPFLMGGIRFLVAGALLYAYTRARGAPPPRAEHWKSSFFIALFLIVGAQGSVAWAEQRIPSGLAAVLVAMTPIWFLLLGLLRRTREPPGLTVLAGLALGLGGVVLLVAPWQEVRSLDLAGVIVVLLGTISWTFGSFSSMGARQPASHTQATSIQMLAGGAMMLSIGTVAGEWQVIAGRDVSTLSVVALAYLIVAGSIIALTTYMWLLTVAPPAKVSTYSYVNPVVALVLGWVVAGEALDLRMAVSALIILVAVVMVTAGPLVVRSVRLRLTAQSGT